MRRRSVSGKGGVLVESSVYSKRLRLRGVRFRGDKRCGLKSVRELTVFRPVFSFFLRLFHCFPVPSSFRVPCSIFLLRRVRTKVFTLIELLMRESCKSGISFRQQGWTGRCQSPDPASSFFLRLFKCSIVFLLLPSLFSV